MLSKEEEKHWEDLLPKRITLAAVMFFMEQDHVESLRWYFVGADYLLNKHLDEVRKKFAHIIHSLDSSISNHLAERLTGPGAAERLFQSETYKAVLGHAIMARTVDNFSTYLKDLLSQVVQSKPDILKSSDKEPLDFILSFNDMNQLKSAIAEKRIESLFYGGIQDIAKFFESRLGVSLFATQDQAASVEYAFRVRNLVVHNRGRIDKRFLNDYPSPNLAEGAMLIFDPQDVSEANLEFQKILVRVDAIVAQKFALDTYENYPTLDPRLRDIRQQVVTRR